MNKNIILSAHSGFCFGVKRSVELAEKALENKSSTKYMLGEIIHNVQVVAQMINKGAKIISDVDEIDDNFAEVIIRAHGEAKSVFDSLEKRKIKYIDTTCPYVKKIHNIVAQYYANGFKIIIIGDKNHPEVIGINGWCDNSAKIYNYFAEFKTGIENSVEFDIIEDNVCLVAQTTINTKVWSECIEYAKKVFPNSICFDTICSATDKRQKNAKLIAESSDIMIVIGGKKSSNTLKLFEICKQHCKHVYHIEEPDELKDITIGPNDVIGITAGASTPAFIIREVIKKMEQEKVILDSNEELSFAEAFEKSFITLNTGDVVSGVVTKITPTEVWLNLGTKHDGYIPVDEFSSDPNAKMEDLVGIGDTVEAFVVRVNDVEGIIMLSKKKIDTMKTWQEINDAVEDGKVLSGIVTEAVKGGMVVLVNGIRVFVPASLASDHFMEDLSSLVGNTVELRILEINRQRKRVIGSVKSVLVEKKNEAASKLWEDIEVNKTYKGVVKSLAQYGAFVDIGGADGMLHISELSWNRIKHPSDVLKVGDIIEVYILKADKETKKISLGYKKASDNPWEIFKSKYKVGDIVSCRIIKMMPFGAFAQIIPGVDGLIHISQISEKRIPNPESVLKIDQNVDAKIVEIDFEKNKVNLSIRALTDIIDEIPVKETIGDNKEDATDEQTTVE